MLFGYDQGVMGSLLTGPSFEATFPSISNGNNTTLQGFTVAVYELGCAAGALTVIISGDRFGRRVTVMLGESIIIVGAILQASSFGLAQMIVGRVVAGFGNGMAAAVLPTWNGECSRPKNRGRAVMWQLNINLFGIALAYWVDYGLAASSVTSNNGWAWRLPLALQATFSFLTIFLALFLPESPRVLIRSGKMAEASDVVDMLSLKEDPDARAMETHIVVSMIEKNLQEDMQSDSRWQAIFTQGKPRYFQRLTLAAFIMCMYQLTGVNLITYYVIFNTACAVGTNGLAFLMPVEMTPLQTRGKSVAISTGLFWLCNFFVVMISPVLISRIGYGTYVLWASTNLCFIPMIYFLVPETCKATLEDIDVLFETNPTWLIGPISKKKLADITKNTYLLNDADEDGWKEKKSSINMVENTSSE
ncbi:Major facilitator superfamily domain, general substrate transporter [Penicillium occitanis (nom. inval.)]|nr:Major facilitator superfamily domain, general substrate transporter [Penicillium occitanis (nom. inval.)]PCH04551.1 hypothetical protein PENOC_033210 [Penicillium occitanis (nom. inval.)]